MFIGALSYCLAVYQIFAGLKEDQVIASSVEEAGIEGACPHLKVPEHKKTGRNRT